MTNMFLSIFGISVSISFIVVMLTLFTPFINKRYNTKWKYLIWIFLSLRLLVPFNGGDRQFVMDIILSQIKMQTGAKLEEKYTDDLRDIRIPSKRIMVEIPAQMTSPMTVQYGKNDTGITMLDIIAIVWMIGVCIFISVHFISYFHYKGQIMKKGRMISDGDILTQIVERKDELHIRRTIQGIEYPEAKSPMIIGFLKPVFVMPREKYNQEDLFFILKHELIHLKRGDVYFKLLFLTANAVHWFNPFIWIMQKEAVIDMELSCDERVVKGASYAVRKAYTETLLSMLHKGCAKRNVLSTQFYGGTKIMKKRFKNILIKNRKKNGIFILICAVVITMGVGTLAGCSIEKENIGNMSGQSEREGIQMEQMPVGHSPADNDTLESTTILTFLKEGEEEEKQAALVIGDGYSIYLPEDEWQQSNVDLWTAKANDQVRIWIEHFEDVSIDFKDQEMEDNGYVTVQGYIKRKQEGNEIYYVRLKEFEKDVWGIFYCYPVDSEEGWGRELPVIADTFVLSIGTDNEKSNRLDDVSEYLGEEDSQKIRNIVDEFATAYFEGSMDTIQTFLASTYEGKIDTFESTGTISDLDVKGLSDTGEIKMENGRCVVSLEFRDSSYEDMLMYLTFVFIEQGGSWKIQFYGLEG